MSKKNVKLNMVVVEQDLYDGFIDLIRDELFDEAKGMSEFIMNVDTFFGLVVRDLRGTDEWYKIDSFMYAEFAKVWVVYKERNGYNVMSKPNFESAKAWLRNAVTGTDLVLRGESALIYMQKYTPYNNPAKIYVYAQAKGNYDNIDYLVVDDIAGLDFVDDGVVKYASFTQIVNEMVEQVERVAGGVLFEALSYYYAGNSQSFTGLEIWEKNRAKFVMIAEQSAGYVRHVQRLETIGKAVA